MGGRLCEVSNTSQQGGSKPPSAEIREDNSNRERQWNILGHTIVAENYVKTYWKNKVKTTASDNNTESKNDSIDDYFSIDDANYANITKTKGLDEKDEMDLLEEAIVEQHAAYLTLASNTEAPQTYKEAMARSDSK